MSQGRSSPSDGHHMATSRGLLHLLSHLLRTWDVIDRFFTAVLGAQVNSFSWFVFVFANRECHW